jgi:membrane protease YdiL (CAAX protease family)
VFVLFLYAAWIAAWVLLRTLEPQVDWIATDAGRFVYWQSMKLLLWIVPGVMVLHASGQRLRDVIGLARVRSIVLWGGGIGLLFAVSTLITRAFSHRSVVEEIVFRGVVLPGLLRRYTFLAANSLTAALFLGIHLPGWYFQGHLTAMLTHPVGGALSIFFIGWLLGLAAYESRSVAGSILAHVLNNLANAF